MVSQVTIMVEEVGSRVNAVAARDTAGLCLDLVQFHTVGLWLDLVEFHTVGLWLDLVQFHTAGLWLDLVQFHTYQECHIFIICTQHCVTFVRL